MLMLSYEGIHRVEYGVQLVYGAPPVAYTRPDHSYASRRPLEVTLWLLVVWCITQKCPKTAETAKSVKLAPQAPPCCHTPRRPNPVHHTSLASSWGALRRTLTEFGIFDTNIPILRPGKSNILQILTKIAKYRTFRA